MAAFSLVLVECCVALACGRGGLLGFGMRGLRVVCVPRSLTISSDMEGICWRRPSAVCARVRVVGLVVCAMACFRFARG